MVSLSVYSVVCVPVQYVPVCHVGTIIILYLYGLRQLCVASVLLWCIPPHPPQSVGVLVCVVCGETHRQHCLVVTPVTSSLKGTHPPVSFTAVIIWRGEGPVDRRGWGVGATYQIANLHMAHNLIIGMDMPTHCCCVSHSPTDITCWYC